MLHRTFEEMLRSIELALRDQPDDAWIVERLKTRGVLFHQHEEEDGPMLAMRYPEGKPDRAIVLILQRSRNAGGEDDSSIVSNDCRKQGKNRYLPVILIGQRPCDPFWFGLKFALSILLHERAYDYGELKRDIAETIETLTAGAPRTRPQLARFRRESKERLDAHSSETSRMIQLMIYRAINRELEGALESVIPKIRQESMVVVEQQLFISHLAEEMLVLTRAAFPAPLSLEEEAARSTLLAVASKYAAASALKPVILC